MSIYFIFNTEKKNVLNEPKYNNTANEKTTKVQLSNSETRNTSAEKEYTNERLKIIFNYPENFYVEEGVAGECCDIIITPIAPDDIMREIGPIFPVSLNIKKISKEVDYKEILNELESQLSEKNTYPKELSEKISKEDKVIDNMPGTLFKTVDGHSGGMITNIFIKFDDYVLRIFYFDDIPYFDSIKQVVNNIKFLK